MNRICAIALFFGSLASAQSPFTLYIHDTTGVLPDTPLPTLYQPANTAVGSNTPTVLKMVNSSANTVYFVGAYLSASATAVVSNSNFSVTGIFQDQVLAPGASLLFTANFAPTTTGVITGYLDLAYQVETSGCVLSGSGTICPGNITNVSTFNGTATAAQLTLSYQSGGSSVTLTPASSSPLNFPNTSLSATSPIVFTLNNASAATITVPAISLAVLNTAQPSAFSIDTSAIPVAIAAGGSANFTVTFAPSQIGLAQSAIQIGSNTYPIQGYGIIVANIDSLQISYTNSAGVLTLPQAATAISFGQVVPGIGASSVLTFKVLNPTTSASAVTIPAVTVSGTGFSAAGTPAANYSVNPGSSINFTIAFAPTSEGSFSGSLAIGTRTFSLSGSAPAAQSPFTLYIHDTTGVLPDTPLPSLYQVASTAVGANTPTVIKMTNSSANTVYFVGAYLSSSASSVASNPNFTVTGLFQDQLLAPGASVLYVLNFAPTTTGVLTGYLDLAYQVETGGCVLSGTGTICPGNITNVSTLNGTATAAQLTLTYQSGGSSVTLTPASSSPLNFPNTSLSATSPIVFTLNNASSATITVPAISLAVLNVYEPSAFSIDTSAIPVAIAAGQSANFTVTFAPSQIGLAQGTIQIGSNPYPIQGYGIIVADIDSLQISYTNSAGVRTLPQAATAISFGQVVPGSGASSVLTFNLLNPTTSVNSVTIPAVTVSGTGFLAAGLPVANYSLSPGSSINFTITFAPTAVGTFTGSLAVGMRTFSLSGVAISSAIPGLSITTSSTVTSAQQLNLVIQSSAAATVATLGTVSMQFAPSISGVTDDAAVMFLATNGRQLNISFNAGSQTATYNGQSSIAFQTGTTAGTLTFTVAFPNTTTYTQSFTIPGTVPQIASTQATSETSYLVINLSGYDNTYSAGQLVFTFYDTSGKVIDSPFAFNETSNFQQLFFVGNTFGGLFTIQATFPVSGDITKVGSVTVGVTNSAGQSTSSATFQ